MEDKKNKNVVNTPEQEPDEKEIDARDLADEKLEEVAGGTTPIVNPFS